MKLLTVEGCLICNGTVTGNVQVGYLCGRCHILFPRIRYKSKREEQVRSFTLFVRSQNQETYHRLDCKYAKRIEDPVMLSPEKTQGLRACSCVGRKRVRQ